MDEKILEEIRQVSKEYPDGIHRRSEAKEMFEKLGFYEDKQHSSTSSIIVYRQVSKGYSLYFDYDKTLDLVGGVIIDLNLLQAINKQVEELGWNK